MADISQLCCLSPESFRSLVDGLTDASAHLVPHRWTVVPVHHPLTLLHIAILRRDMELVGYLVEKHHVNPHVVTDNKKFHVTAFQFGGLLFQQSVALFHWEFDTEAEKHVFHNDHSALAALDLELENLGLAVYYAAAQGALQCLKVLKDHVHTKMPMMQLCPLHCAACNGQLECVQWLITEANVDVKASDVQGKTALLWGARTGQLPVVRWLLQEGGATIDERSDDGDTALLWAARPGELQVMKWLVEKGNANICDGNKQGQTALLIAAGQGHLDAVQYLILEAGAAKSQCNKGGITALMFAACYGHLPVVKWLIQQAGFDVTVCDSDGFTALSFAALLNHLPVVQWLILSTHVNPRGKNRKGETPALLAAVKGNTEILKWLIEHNYAGPNDVDYTGCTALFHAARKGNLASVKYLVAEAGALPDARIESIVYPLQTPLQVAIGAKKVAVVRWLVMNAWVSPYDVHVAFLRQCDAEHLLQRWTPKLHPKFPPCFQHMVRLLVWTQSRPRVLQSRLPVEVVACAIQFLEPTAWPPGPKKCAQQ